VLINLIIIYFACGSPIGVYRITRTARLRSPGQAAAIGVYFVLWPIFVPTILLSSLSGGEAAKIDVERGIARIRAEMENIAFSDDATVSVFEFREVFGRFTGLTIMLNHRGAAQVPNELFKIAGHNNLALASACLKRRDRQRLASHQMQARAEFEDLIAKIARFHPHGDVIAAMGSQLLETLDGRSIPQPRP